MDYSEEMKMDKVDFGDMPPQAFLLGLLSAFDNRYQAAADAYNLCSEVYNQVSTRSTGENNLKLTG